MTSQLSFENELAVLEHRVAQLEKEPPRVRSLENEVGVIKSTIDTMTRDVADVKSDVHDMKERISKTATTDDVSSIKDAVIKIMAYGTACLTLLGVIMTVTAIIKNAEGLI